MQRNCASTLSVEILWITEQLYNNTGHQKEIGTNRKYRGPMMVTQRMASLLAEDHFVYIRLAFFVRIKYS